MNSGEKKTGKRVYATSIIDNEDCVYAIQNFFKTTFNLYLEL